MPQPQQSLTPDNYFGIGRQSYGSYFPNSQRTTNPYGAQFFDPTAQSRAYDQGQLQALQESYDPNDPQSVSGLERLIAVGKVSPSAGRALLPKTGRNTPLSDADAETYVSLMNDFKWSDPDALQKAKNILQANPSFAKNPRAQSILTGIQQVQSRTPKTGNDLEDQLALAGVNPETWDQFRDKNGQLNRAKALYAIWQSKTNAKNFLAPTIKQRQQVVDAFHGLNQEPSDDQKVDAYNAAHNTQLTADKMTPQQWQEAWGLHKKQSQQNLINTIDELQQAGVRLPDAVQHATDALLFPKTSQAGPQGVPTIPQQAVQTPPSNNPFSQIAQVLQEQKAKENALKLQNQQADEAAWEKAKGELLTGNPELFSGGRVPSPTEIQNTLRTKLQGSQSGIGESLLNSDLSKTSFTDSSGRNVPISEVIDALSTDPRLDQLRELSTGTSPIKTPGGNRVKIGTLSPPAK